MNKYTYTILVKMSMDIALTQVYIIAIPSKTKQEGVLKMKKGHLFSAIMRLIDKHSAFLQSHGWSKWAVRDHSPVHAVLVKLAFYAQRAECSGLKAERRAAV